MPAGQPDYPVDDRFVGDEQMKTYNRFGVVSVSGNNEVQAEVQQKQAVLEKMPLEVADGEDLSSEDEAEAISLFPFDSGRIMSRILIMAGILNATAFALAVGSLLLFILSFIAPIALCMGYDHSQRGKAVTGLLTLCGGAAGMTAITLLMTYPPA